MSLSSTLSRSLLGLTLAGVLSLTAGLALAVDVTEGSYAGKDGAEITESLQAQGYKVRKIEKEDGYLEAYALLDGHRYEIYVDPQSGKVVKIEQDD